MQVSAEDAPVIKLVYSILAQAVGEGASDIHLEPEEGELRIRFRIDGVLKEAAHVPRRMIGAVISRLKIMSELDIAEKRVPQDGRVSVTVEERRIDLRVTTLPTQRGEGATIRILDEGNAQRSLDDLGMDGSARARFEDAFSQAYGAVLVTGPTGSGKSTTLYAALQELNQIEKKIITIEDPVEYRIAGINQINVNRKAGLDFATGLRSILRADPDIVMVGEIRDAETARIAIEAALTGHMMLTTLHTNDAPGAIARLNEMGIETFLTASAVDCVVAQRLARKLCPHCKRRTIIPAAALAEAGIRADADVEAYEPVGCGRCSQHRLQRPGRHLLGDEPERAAQGDDRDRAPEPEIAAVAREEGMLTLREDGVAKVRARPDQPRGGAPCHRLTSTSPRCCAAWSRRRPPTSTSPPGFPPAMRDKGKIMPMEGFPVLTAQQTREVVYGILNDDQRKRFENNQQLDFAYAIPGVARFRVNCFFQRGSVSAAFRLVPQEIPALDSLGRAAGAARADRETARLRPRHRPDRLGQVDDAGGDDRRDQPRARGPHPHDRGPDRVPAPRTNARSSTSARSAPTRRTSPSACGPRCARTPT